MKKTIIAVALVCISGWIAFNSISSASADALKLSWQADTQRPINLPPVISGNLALVIPSGEPLRAFDAKDGTLRWQYTPAEGVWDRGLGANDTHVFVCLKSGAIVALDITNGQEQWRTQLGINCQRPPHIIGDAVFVSTTFVGPGLPSDTFSGAKVFSINAASGKINWQFTTDTYLLQSPTASSDTLFVGGSYRDESIKIDEGGHVYFYALDMQSGKQKWRVKSQDGFPKSLYATEHSVTYIGYQDFVGALDARDGSLKWRRDTGNWVPALTGMGNVIYYGSANTRVHAWDADSGAEIWNFNIPGGSFNYLLGRAVFENDRMFFMSQKGTAYALDRHTGDVIWSYPTEIDARVGVSVSNGMMYIGDSAGRVRAYRMMQ